MVDEVFSYEDNGFPGDEDNGTMACWYMFAVLGLYPMCPGKPEFTVTEPLVASAELVIGDKIVDLLEKLKGQQRVRYFDLIGEKGDRE